MSQYARAAAVIEERGHGTVDDILPELEGMTRKQAIRALINAARHGLLTCDGRTFAIGRRGTVPAIYRPAVKTYGRPVSSVWELGARA